MAIKYEKMVELRDSLVKPCLKCKGVGHTYGIIDGANYAIECVCVKKFRTYIGYAKAGIDREYWDLTIDDFVGNKMVKIKVNEFMNDIERVRKDGLGITFCGPNGTGKTLSSILILKAAYEKKYSIAFTTMGELLTLLKSSFNKFDEDAAEYYDEYKRLIEESDFLVLDNMGSEYVSSKNVEFPIAQMDYLFRVRGRNLLSTFITTNYSESDFRNNYGKSINSLLSNRNEFLEVQGKDYRTTHPKTSKENN